MRRRTLLSAAAAAPWTPFAKAHDAAGDARPVIAWPDIQLLDGGDLRQRLNQRRVIPMTCLIDRQGRLLLAIPGEMFEDDVIGLARTLQRPPA